MAAPAVRSVNMPVIVRMLMAVAMAAVMVMMAVLMVMLAGMNMRG